MTKPIDNGEDKNLKTGFLRGMTASTLERRFGLQNKDGHWRLRGENLKISDLPACPECGGPTGTCKVTLAAGVDVFYPQCISNGDKDHGFSKFSKHGTRAPMGRKFGSKNEPKEETKAVPEKRDETVISVPDGKIVHPEVLRAAKYVLAGERNIYLSGPAGTGKSTGAEDIFNAMRGNEKWSASSVMHMLTVSMSTFVADLAGYLDRLDKGQYLESDLVKALKVPGLVVVDEADKGNPNLAGFWNTILANNKITTPGGLFDRHPDNVVLFIGNTTGHAPSKQYSGSVRQDFATLDRFRCFNVGFNESVEKSAIKNLNGPLYEIIQKIRKNAETSGLQRIIGLRWARRCNQAFEIEGKNAKDTILQVMRDECWSDDEILASGINDLDKPEPQKATPGKIKYYAE